MELTEDTSAKLRPSRATATEMASNSDAYFDSRDAKNLKLLSLLFLIVKTLIKAAAAEINITNSTVARPDSGSATDKQQGITLGASIGGAIVFIIGVALFLWCHGGGRCCQRSASVSTRRLERSRTREAPQEPELTKTRTASRNSKRRKRPQLIIDDKQKIPRARPQPNHESSDSEEEEGIEETEATKTTENATADMRSSSQRQLDKSYSRILAAEARAKAQVPAPIVEPTPIEDPTLQAIPPAWRTLARKTSQRVMRHDSVVESASPGSAEVSMSLELSQLDPSAVLVLQKGPLIAQEQSSPAERTLNPQNEANPKLAPRRETRRTKAAQGTAKPTPKPSELTDDAQRLSEMPQAHVPINPPPARDAHRIDVSEKELNPKLAPRRETRRTKAQQDTAKAKQKPSELSDSAPGPLQMPQAHVPINPPPARDAHRIDVSENDAKTTQGNERRMAPALAQAGIFKPENDNKAGDQPPRAPREIVAVTPPPNGGLGARECSMNSSCILS